MTTEQGEMNDMQAHVWSGLLFK